MKAFLFAVALVVPSWAQETCSMLNVTCGMQGAMCGQMPNMTDHTYMSCNGAFVCSVYNWTCRTKPMVGTPCPSGSDWECQYMNNEGNELECNSTTNMCQVPMPGMAPPMGCRANGDPCSSDNDCAWGSCTKGWCMGLPVGANCSNENYWGCMNGAFCWSPDGSMNNGTCAMRHAVGAAASNTAGGYGWSCTSGFARNVTSGTPTCISLSAWWGTIAAGGMCWENEIGSASHDLCMPGLYCDPSTNMCASDNAFPATCNMFSGDCSGPNRGSNQGTCHCEISGNAPVCVRNDMCQNAGLAWDNYAMNWAKCGVDPDGGQGRCPVGDSYPPDWPMSCSYKMNSCWPTKAMQSCQMNFDLTHYKKVLVPSGKVCGMNPGPMVWTPSYCSSASIAQPLIFVVVALMAFLRLA